MQQATATDLAAFRRFSRYFTRRTGVLADRYLEQNRPLGQARLLFEIGTGTQLGELRQRLGLDAGQLSRMLSALERDGLVELRPDRADARRRVAELTPAGGEELAEQQRRADEAAAGVLAGLAPPQRAELLTALTTAERLLRLAAITIAVADPAGPDARRCLAAYAAEIGARFPEGYDEGELVAPGEVSGRAGTLLVAYEEELPAACGAVRTLAPGVGEIRHLWVSPATRRLGLARRLLAELERRASEHGHHTLRLNTHRTLTEAISLYRAAGYAEVPAYSGDPHGDLWLGKDLPG